MNNETLENLTEKFAELNINNIDKVIKIQRWFRKCMSRLNKYEETKIKLKELLDKNSNKIHTETIMKLKTLKDAHIYCKINNLSGQFTGLILEKYIKKKYKMTKNSTSSCNGDLKYNEINIEIKTSNGGKENNKFNYVQLRMNHNCIYINSILS
jgi:hypothetical protein